LYFKTGSSYISAANGAILTKFGTLTDFDLLKAVTSTNIIGVACDKKLGGGLRSPKA